MRRCHDHKFDPITQKDYYGLQAILAGVNHAERMIPAPNSEARRRQASVLLAELSALTRGSIPPSRSRRLAGTGQLGR